MVIAKDLREEILRKLKTEPLVRISASEAEYLELAKINIKVNLVSFDWQT